MQAKITVYILLFLFFFFKNFETQAQVLDFDMDKPKTASLKTVKKTKYEAMLNGGLAFVPDRFGNDCRALQFDGTGYLRVQNSENLHLRDFSFSVWLKMPEADFRWLTLLCKGETVQEMDNSPAYRVELTSGTASYNFPSTRLIGRVQHNFPTNTWFHLSTVKKGSEYLIYIDGKLAYSYEVESEIVDNNEPINIGRDLPGSLNFFVGVMDDLRLYDYPLKNKEIEKLSVEKNAKKGSACQPNKPIVSQTTTDLNIDLTGISPEPEPKITENPQNTGNTSIDSTFVFDGGTVKIGELINLKNIQFRQSKSDLLDPSMPILNKVVKLMTENPTMQIEVHGHTDNVGDPTKNYQLSVDRVEAVKKYLISQGIEANRLLTKAFGGTKPIADNSREETRKLNRRVEMRIVRK